MSRAERLSKRPDLAGLLHHFPYKYPHYLSSATELGMQHPNERYSILFRASDEILVLDGSGGLCGRDGTKTGFLAALDRWYGKKRTPVYGDLPFDGGWFLYLGYETVAEIEPVLELPGFPPDSPQSGFPIAFAQRCPGAVIIDHQLQSFWIVAEDAGLRAEIQADLDALPETTRFAELPTFELHTEPDGLYRSAVRRAIDYIHAGDVFQVNLSRRWSLSATEAPDPLSLLANLQNKNPAPFAGLCRFGGQAIISSSPERLLEIRGRQVQTRPIAGTRPRHSDPRGDQALHEELIAHPKERAEHIMLIDLERNDLGRVCETGSIEVNELMAVEKHPHVHHIVSNIRGRLRADRSPIDAIRAVFPGGTITGCPKVRCMQIIAELEAGARGVYTGSMGYLGRNGNLDLNILIRSLFQNGKKLEFRTGGGIVADSDPQQELEETEAKARGLLVALGIEE